MFYEGTKNNNDTNKLIQDFIDEEKRTRYHTGTSN